MKCWTAQYSIIDAPWEQNLRAMIGKKEHGVTLITQLRNPRLDPRHPFAPLCGINVCTLKEEELWYVLAEIERKLKPKRKWLFIQSHMAAVRVIFPHESANRQVGIYIANPVEQEKLSHIFRAALAEIETT